MDYNVFVLKWFSQLDATLDESQEGLRTYIAASCSFLVLDSAHKKPPDNGLAQWTLGMSRIMDMVAAIHNPLLEYETVAGLSRALSECWTASFTLGTPGNKYIQDNITAIAERLRKVLDDPDSATPTFKNQQISLNFV
jgi:hypothetical protein